MSLLGCTRTKLLGIRVSAILAVSLCTNFVDAAPPLTSTTNGIYVCEPGDGRRLTSDRPLPECAGREQKLLNSDGSLRRKVPPTLSPDEANEEETRQRKVAAEVAAVLDIARRDKNLMRRYPNETSHQVARNEALDDMQKARGVSEERLTELAEERKPILAETEFYKNRTLPAKLKQELDANDAAEAAQRSLIDNQKSELIRINARYDAELARLRRLWAGAVPGSMGAMPSGLAPTNEPVSKATKPASR